MISYDDPGYDARGDGCVMAEVHVTRRPIFIGIGGDSGSGKTTLSSAFQKLFGTERITTICLDDYHSLDRRERQLVGVTPLNPRANNFALMEEQIWALKSGDEISKPVYDHSNGTFRPPVRLRPRQVVIVQGLHPFLVAGIRHAFDLKVWLDPEAELRVHWKIQRDVGMRGYTEQQVCAEIEARRPDAQLYIAPQRKHADLVVRFYRPQAGPRDMGHLNVRVTQRHTLPRLRFDHELHDAHAIRLFLDVLDDGQRADILEVDGSLGLEEARLLERNILAHFVRNHENVHDIRLEMLGVYEAVARKRRHSDPLALAQLILAHRILSAQKSMLLRVPLEGHREYAGFTHQHMEET